MKEGKDCIGVFVTAICHDGKGKFLMGKRNENARDCNGLWDFGGGTLEYGESIEIALIREMKEEFGANLSNIKKVDVRESVEENKHWLGIYHVALIDKVEEVYIAEDVYSEIGWFTLDTMPKELIGDDAEHVERYLRYI